MISPPGSAPTDHARTIAPDKEPTVRGLTGQAGHPVDCADREIAALAVFTLICFEKSAITRERAQGGVLRNRAAPVAHVPNRTQHPLDGIRRARGIAHAPTGHGVPFREAIDRNYTLGHFRIERSE